MVKLKCVDNIDKFGLVANYLTVGKTYIAEHFKYGIYKITDDDGDVIYAVLNESDHAKWEII